MAASEAVRTAKYVLSGLAAIDPKALGLEFLLAPPAPLDVPNGVACVHVCGPLAFGGFLFDTYAAIRARVRAALESDAHTVLLVFDSPGGDVDGCFDCARGLRADAAAAGKRLIGWVPSKVCSAAYALSTACSELHVASSAQVGSIGVIHELQDVTKQDAAAGISYAYVVSGAKKALGNPHRPIDETTLAEAQAMVDTTAELLFALVKETRGFNPEALQASILVGAAAVEARLADSVTTLDALLAKLGAQEPGSAGAIQPESAASASSAAAPCKDPMAGKAEDKKDDKDEMRASLAAAAKTNARAARALKAYDEDDDGDKAQASDGDDDKKKDDDKAQAKAEFPKKDDDKALAAASSLGVAVASQAAEIASLKASLAARDKRDADAERAAFFAQHASLPAALLESLKDLPLEQCKTIVAAVPAQFRTQAVTPEAQAVRGVAQAGGSEAARTEFMASPLAAKMGAVKTERIVEMEPNGLVQNFGVRKVKA